MTPLTRVHVVTLGCARNEVDSEELAGRLADGGFELVDDPGSAEAVLVNTCGFIDAAKKDSVDTLLAASDLKDFGTTKAVIAVGCMAERYGKELADALPEADAVLGFDDYASIAERVTSILAGGHHTPHVPRDRRELLPLAPTSRPAAAKRVAVPGHGSFSGPASGPRPLRRRLDSSPTASLKIASGCDRRCAFCAIPSFRGSYVSRPIDDLVAEASWLVDQGVRELFLVSENTSSYGKDLGDPRALERLVTELSAIDDLGWIRLSYLQPAEVRPRLLKTMAANPKVVNYFDLPFQHASGPVLRRMRRFGDEVSFAGLVRQVRDLVPEAGIRSNVIVGFPGETEEDVDVLTQFLIDAELDVVGVFAYSDEEGTEGVTLPSKVDPDVIEDRRSRVADIAAEIMEQRASARVGQAVEILVEGFEDGSWYGRAAHQGPEVDGSTRLVGHDSALRAGDIVAAVVTDSDGIDLIAARGGA